MGKTIKKRLEFSRSDGSSYEFLRYSNTSVLACLILFFVFSLSFFFFVKLKSPNKNCGYFRAVTGGNVASIQNLCSRIRFRQRLRRSGSWNRTVSEQNASTFDDANCTVLLFFSLTSLVPSHCIVACLEIMGRYGFFCVRFVPKW